MKRILAVLLLLLTAAGGVVAGPARAGDGASRFCANGVGPDHPILNNPITLGYQSDPGSFLLCYSTTPWGEPGGVSGAINVLYQDNTGTSTVTAQAVCYADPSAVFAPACNTSMSGASGGTVTYTPGTTTYARDANGPCLWVAGQQYLATCTSEAAVAYSGGDGPSVQTQSTGQCLVGTATYCYAYLSGVRVSAGQDATNPLVTVYTPYGSVPVNVPKTCYYVLNPPCS